ncbi:MAG: efflux RND transporter permease subunit [Saprospiraceae bacterium]|jgi:multidrug efflux pump subunit AcrB|nr:efflux RND transporter permease subunit [Saprospiraceae bacterium]
MKIAEFSVKNSQFTFIIFLAVMALGIGSLLNMPRAEDPKFEAPGFTVIIVYPGAGPAEIEDKIADKVEAKLGALENIDRMRSVSANGLMALTQEFKHGQDPEKKYEEVLREINALRPDLPQDLYRIEVQRFSASDVLVLQTAILSENASWQQMREQAERLEDMLEKIPGLKGADVFGFPKREVRIALNLPRMAAEGIPVSRVLGALQSENVSIPGGAVHVGERQFFVQTSGDYEDIEDVRNTIVFANGGKIVYLKDLAEVEFAYEEPRHIARFNGTRSVFVTARMKNGQNIAVVGQQVNAALETFREDLPANMDFQKVLDQEDSVSKRLSRFSKDFAIAILLVLLTLLPLGTRASLVVMISIPLSIAIGLFALDLLGYSLNQLSIVGLIIALGILVDDSIVVVENIERWLREGHNRRDAAILATKQIGLAVLGCTATLILAFLPLVFLPEAAGDFIRSLPMAVVTTVLASLFVSLTIVPFLGSRLLAEHHDPRGNIFLRGLRWAISKTYARLLTLGLRYPRWTMVASAAIFFGVLALAGRAGFTVFPASERPMFYIDVETAPGTNIEYTDRVMQMVDSVLATYMPEDEKNLARVRQVNLAASKEQKLETSRSTYPGHGAPARIVSFATNVGHGNPRMYYNVIPRNESPDYGQIIVQLQDRTPPPVKVALIDELRERFKNVPGAVITVKNFEQGPPIEAPIAIRVFGENLDTLRSVAARVENMVSEIEGAIYVDNSIAAIKTDLQVNINRDKATSLGIPIVEIDRAIRLAVAGLNMGSFSTPDGDEYNLSVTLPKNTVFAGLDVFKNIYVNSLTGAAVPLSQVATLEFKRAPNVITHYDRDRYTLITAFVKSGYFAQDINTKIQENLEKMDFPKGTRYVIAGEVETSQRSFGGMGTIILITIFGLLAVLILEFKTFRSTIIVLSVIPLGVIGAVLALLVTGYPFSFTVVVGLIALMGIEVKNSILLVDFTNQLRLEGKGIDEAIQEAGEIRFVPILLTSLTAIGGLMPLAIEENPLYSPLAYVLIGGLISSTLLSRIVTPVLYKLLAPRVVH